MSNLLGVSSACFYPQLTEESADITASLGIPVMELFLNSFSEMDASYIRQLKTKMDEKGVRVVSVHPFMSFAESSFLFGNYERRFTDTLSIYQRFFELTAELGADIFVIHGLKNIPKSEQKTSAITDEQHFERFAKMIECGKKQGIHVCQENVVKYKAQSPEYLKQMADYIGKDFGIVLDIKQALRAGYSPFAFINTLAPFIRHVHISDHNNEIDCMAPGKGNFDFAAFFQALNRTGYTGAYIIELYRYSYKGTKELTDSYLAMQNILQNIR